MINVVPFKPEHVRQMSVQPIQRIEMDGNDTKEHLEMLSQHVAYTGISDGNIIVCAGFFPIWENRYYAWALLSDLMNKNDMIVITRAVKRGMDLLNSARIETVVQSDFETGHRWMNILGFKRETPEPMKKYFPHGGDAVLYARVT